MSEGYQPRRQHGVVKAPPKTQSHNPAHKGAKERQVEALESIAASLSAIVALARKAEG